jgi:hypothetical protein
MEEEEEEVPDEPSALVSSLTRFIVREYAASRRFGIPLDEIFDTVNWAHKKEMSDENSEQGQAYFCTHLSR